MDQQHLFMFSQAPGHGEVSHPHLSKWNSNCPWMTNRAPLSGRRNLQIITCVGIAWSHEISHWGRWIAIKQLPALYAEKSYKTYFKYEKLKTPLSTKNSGFVINWHEFVFIENDWDTSNLRTMVAKTSLVLARFRRSLVSTHFLNLCFSNPSSFRFFLFPTSRGGLVTHLTIFKMPVKTSSSHIWIDFRDILISNMLTLRYERVL